MASRTGSLIPGRLWLFGRRRQARLISRFARRILPEHPLGVYSPLSARWPVKFG